MKATDFISRPLKAFVSGYSPIKFTESELSSCLSRIFPFEMKISMPSKNSYWKGYAFVDFSNREEFLAFVRKRRIRLDEFEMNLVLKAFKDGKQLRKNNKDLLKRTLEISNIPSRWDDLTLEAYFGGYGKMENAYVKRSWKSDSEQRIGVLVFSSKKVAKSVAIRKCFEVDGQKLEVFAKESQRSQKADNGGIKKNNTKPKIAVQKSGNIDNKLIIEDVEEIEKRNSKLKNLISFDYELAYHQLKPTSNCYFIESRPEWEEKERFCNLRLNYSLKKPLGG